MNFRRAHPTWLHTIIPFSLLVQEWGLGNVETVLLLANDPLHHASVTPAIPGVSSCSSDIRTLENVPPSLKSGSHMYIGVQTESTDITSKY